MDAEIRAMGPSQGQPVQRATRGASEARPRPATEHPGARTTGRHPPTLPSTALCPS